MSVDSKDEKRIFYAASAVSDPAERKSLLDHLCDDDADLRARVDALFLAHDSHMLDRSAPDSDLSEAGLSSDKVGTIVGRYKLLQRIGEGGFGIVYMAEQQEPVSRKVALKIIKPGMDTKQVIARFEAERQALALMDHPNIAKVLDAGTTDNGRPYFAMDLIHGIPVTDYCNDRSFTTTDRLKLFGEICSAIQHAHQKGIIHRDLKPTNILVSTDGDRPVPKVIDFGIAKATQGRLTDKTLFTQFQQFVGTPAYMSPEQAQMSAVEVDTRSDIYSLGVLLYELLTGKTPFDSNAFFKAGYEEICRRIREEDPVKPSKRLSSLQHGELTTLAKQRRIIPSQFLASVRGDLDWIVMKAVEKDRSRRYDSCGMLAADIERFLKNEPVVAGPPTAAYHLRKLVQRNRTVVVTMLAIAVSLILGTVIATLGWLQAIEEKQRTELAKENLSEQVTLTQNALDSANESKQQADDEKRRAIDVAYLADMQAGHQARDQDRLDLARRILNRNKDFKPDHDPRHWEYRALWARCQGNAERSFGLQDGTIHAIGVHPGGTMIVTGGHRIRVWDVNSGKLVHEFPVEGVGQFAPNGHLLYTTEPSGFVRAWRVPGFESTDFKVTHANVFSYRRDMQISPNGKFLATFGDDSDVVVWDVETREPLKRISTAEMYCHLVFSPDSSKLALGNGRIRIVDLSSMKVADFLDDAGKPLHGDVVFSSDGKRIARNDGLGFAVHRISDGRQIAGSHQHDQEVNWLTYSPDGATLATASIDRTVLLHDVETNEVIAKLWDHDLGVSRVAFLPDGRVVSGGRAGKICIWNVDDATREPPWPISAPEAYHWNRWNYWPAISCSPDGSTIASTNLQVRKGSPPGTKPKPGITLRSAFDLQQTATLAESSGQVRAVLYSPVDDLLVITNQVGALEFITPNESGADHSAQCALQYPDGFLVPVRFTPDGKRLLVVVMPPKKRVRRPHEEQKTIAMAVYRVADRQQLAKWTIPPEFSATISPDGSLVVTAHHDGVRLWSIDNPVTSTHIPVGGFRAGIAERIWSVDFSPDGRHVIAGANINGLIEIVDVQTKQSVGQLQGHVGTVGAVRLSPDGKRIASGGSQFSDTVKIWDFETRREIITLTVDGSWGTRHLEWLPDGNTIMVGSGDSILSIFRVPSMTGILAASAN